VALAVLSLSGAAKLASSSRVLTHREVESVVAVQQLCERSQAELQRSAELAALAAQEQVRRELTDVQARLQRELVIKATALQLSHERSMREHRARFVETVMSCLGSLLQPLPPEFFARVQASAAALVGDNAQTVLHVAACDEPAARTALAALGQPVSIVVDPDLGAGRCFLDTRFGRLQTGLPDQLEILEEALKPWWAEQAAA
jgi:flagellar biosynthesis/type III secretory pathway protein FliH